MEATPKWATTASAPCKEPVRRTWGLWCLLGTAMPRAWLSFVASHILGFSPL